MNRYTSMLFRLALFVLATTPVRGQRPELVLPVSPAVPIQVIAFSPDDRFLATGGDNNAIDIWDASTGYLLRTFSGNSITRWSNGKILALAISPDGEYLAGSSGSDNSLKIWNVQTGALVRTLTGPANGLAFSPSGRQLIAGNGNAINIWNVENGTIEKTLACHFLLGMNALAISASGKRVVSGSDDGTVEVWDVATGKEIRTMGTLNPPITVTSNGRELTDDDPATVAMVRDEAGAAHGVLSVAFCNNDTRVVSAGKENKITIWDSNTGKPIHILAGHVGDVNSIACSSDGTRLVSAGGDHSIRVWDTATGTIVKTLTGHSGPIYSVSLSPDAKRLASGSADTTAKIWDTETGREIRTLSSGLVPIGSVSVSTDWRRFVCSTSSQSVIVWNTGAGSGARTIYGPPGSMHSVALSEDGSKIVTGGDDAVVSIWDAETGRRIHTFGHSAKQNQGDVDSSWWVREVAFSPDGSLIASATEFDITLWDVETETKLKTLHGFTQDLTFSQNGKRITASGYGGFIEVWDVGSGRQIGKIQGPSSWNGMVFFADGKRVLSGGADLKIWNVETGALLRTLKGKANAVSPVAVSRDSRFVMSGSDDGTVEIWDLNSGKAIHTYGSDLAAINAVGFSPDGKLAFAGSYDGKIRIWDVGTGTELLSMVTTSDVDWLAATPNGFFDGSSNAWKHLAWRFNGDTFDYGALELYFNDFFRPDLLSDVLKRKSVTQTSTQELNRLDRRQPKVAVRVLNVGASETSPGSTPPSRSIPVAPKRQVEIEIEVAEDTHKTYTATERPGSGARDLRLFRNGTLVKVWHGDLFSKGNSDGCQSVRTKVPDAARRIVCHAFVNLEEGLNTISAYAFNDDNVKSNDTATAVIGGLGVRSQGILYVLAIGINAYSHIGPLTYAVNDATELGEELFRQQVNLGRFRSTQIITITDRDATKQNIIEALSRLGTKASRSPLTNLEQVNRIRVLGPQDALLITFSGHGITDGNRFYLLPTDFDETAMAQTSISDLELSDVLEAIDAAHIALIMDACQSGKALGGVGDGRAPMNSKGLAQLAFDKGIDILAASQADQSAFEFPTTESRAETKHGFLTYALLEALATSTAADEAGNLAISQWFDFAAHEVPRLQRTELEQWRTKRKEQLATSDDETFGEMEEMLMQTPRVFYKRDESTHPLFVAMFGK